MVENTTSVCEDIVDDDAFICVPVDCDCEKNVSTVCIQYNIRHESFIPRCPEKLRRVASAATIKDKNNKPGKINPMKAAKRAAAGK